VRRDRLAAVFAYRGRAGRQGMVRAAHILPGMGRFLFWDSHFKTFFLSISYTLRILHI
jgi:hypothetical protein